MALSPKQMKLARRLKPYAYTIGDALMVVLVLRLIDWLFGTHSNFTGILALYILLRVNIADLRLADLRESR